MGLDATPLWNRTTASERAPRSKAQIGSDIVPATDPRSQPEARDECSVNTIVVGTEGARFDE